MPTFAVNCPGCGVSKEHMTTTANKIGVHCSCGISFSVNIEEQTVDDWWERKGS
ncbi:hypothetical protein [Halorubrum sp. BOL3-1]|uniref:hypothetical protein n=1 Tax=Halorubrum sp. BOL3-1 TaxID=2497325 RepID=UPI00140E5DA7|nr:hypothetical protein [Halorubrum sp. BOL3-1]